MYKPILFALVVICQLVQAQDTSYSSLTLPDALKENANAIVRERDYEVKILSQKAFILKKREVVTVLNEKGMRNLDLSENYSPSLKINSLSVVVYNALGNEIKKYRQSDFKDHSVSDGFSIATDDRVLYLDYTPIGYPFTVVFESEVKSTNTAFLQPWAPIGSYYESVQKARIHYSYPDDLRVKVKEINFEGHTIQKEESAGKIMYSIENFKAEKPEDYSPPFYDIFPMVRFALDKFNLEGVEGNADTWPSYGSWYYNSLLTGTDELPDATVVKMQSLVKDAKTNVEKAQKIYEYVQNKTRYVSIQLGVGGWKPMLAKDVDRLGYGDCKALSNYTRALLKAVGVESYCTIIYAGKDTRDLTTDFVAMQGNHMILALPDEKGGYLFMECTSQSNPFGYQGSFTDDRYALLIKPQGGEIVKTNDYNNRKSTQITTGTVTIAEDGSMRGVMLRKSAGFQYSNSEGIELKSKKDVDEKYKEEMSWINNLILEKYKFVNDKKAIEFTEELVISSPDYVKKSGQYQTLEVNVFNQTHTIPTRYRNRKYPFEIARGFYDEDTIIIELPKGYKIESLPESTTLEDKFGEYRLSLTLLSPEKIEVKRSFFMKKGLFEKTDYESFRKFREQVARLDATKVVLIKA